MFDFFSLLFLIFKANSFWKIRILRFRSIAYWALGESFTMVKSATVLPGKFFKSTWYSSLSSSLILAFLSVILSSSTSTAWSSEELKKIVESNDVEAAWEAIHEIPRDISLVEKERTVKVLMAALQREWPRCTGDIRQEIAYKLADFDTEAAIPLLIELIRKEENIEHECAECGCCFAYHSISGAFLSLEPDFFCENAVLSALHSLATFSYAKDVSELAQSDTPFRPQLLVILGNIGSGRYAHFIAKYADSGNNMTRLAVAFALGEMKQPSGIPVLGRLLEDSSETVRWAASSSLTSIAGERVVDTVRLRLLHPDKEVRALAARTLAFLGVAEGFSLLRTMAKQEENPRNRSLAIAYLGQLKDAESRSISLSGLKAGSILVRAYSIYALGYVGKAADISAIEASLSEAKTMIPAPADREALQLIDETARETLEQIRSRSLEG
jgi:HEAT repeat protein